MIFFKITILERQNKGQLSIVMLKYIMTNPTLIQAKECLTQSLQNLWQAQPGNAIHPDHQAGFIKARLRAYDAALQCFSPADSATICAGIMLGESLAMHHALGQVAPDISGFSDATQLLAQEWAARLRDNDTIVQGWDKLSPITREAACALHSGFMLSCQDALQTNTYAGKDVYTGVRSTIAIAQKIHDCMGTAQAPKLAGALQNDIAQAQDALLQSQPVKIQNKPTVPSNSAAQA